MRNLRAFSFVPVLCVCVCVCDCVNNCLRVGVRCISLYDSHSVSDPVNVFVLLEKKKIQKKLVTPPQSHDLTAPVPSLEKEEGKFLFFFTYFGKSVSQSVNVCTLLIFFSS
jgi:hypothetical protein